jgi:hypothetical protein
VNDTRRLALGCVALVVAILAGGLLDRPAAQNKPEGEMRWALYVTLSPAEARRLLAEAGFGPGKPLRVELATRSWALQVDLAVFVQEQLRQVGVEATLKPMDLGVWYPATFFYENYKCGSRRNYSEYCNPEVDDLIDRQSREIDPKKRLALRLLRPVALREKSRPASRHLQLRPDAGGVAGQVAALGVSASARRDSGR